MSDVDPKSIAAVPSPSNVVSRAPLGINRVTIIIALMLALPARTILRSGCTSTALALPPPGSVTRPPLPKSGSSAPVARSRATTAPAAVERPATTMRPSAWRAIASPKSSPPKSTVAMPPVRERRVQRAVGLQARDLDVPALGAREAAEQDLAVRRHDHGGSAADRAPAEGLPAVAVEGRVERAVGLQAHDGDLQARISGEHDLAVGLQGRAVDGLVVGAEVDHALAARAEGGIERAVGGAQAHDAEGARRAAAARGDHPPVGLHEHGLRRIGAAEVDRLLPAAAEARIEVTRVRHAPTVPARGRPVGSYVVALPARRLRSAVSTSTRATSSADRPRPL